MKAVSTPIIFGILATCCVSCASEVQFQAPVGAETDAGRVVIAPAQGTNRPPFAFTVEDEKLLDEIQRGCFNFLWEHVDPVTGMVPDRASEPVVSIAGVGFQLSGICVGVERGWITREQGSERCVRILRALAANPDNRKAGLFYHFVDGTTAGQPSKAYEHVVSTIDSALFFCGVITASQYFGGEVRSIGDRLIDDANWAFFRSTGPGVNAHEQDFVTLGWKPNDLDKPSGEGKLLPYVWVDSGDEHRLVTFLAVAAPREAHRMPPETYYRLRRGLGEYKDTGPFVWFPWSGALFVQIFAHCWLDYSAMGPDDPAAFGVAQRARVDWWENARRTVRMHRLKAEENPQKKPTLGATAWGLTASDVANGYAVPGLFPDPIPMPGARAEFDYPVHHAKEAAKDNYGDGTIAPYGAGCAIMFDPQGALAALRYYRSLTKPDGTPLLWSDPAVIQQNGPGKGKLGYGFADSFNLGTGWVAPDYVAIDQGPLLLAIENARTGLLWKIFHAHPLTKSGLERLKLKSGR